MVRHSRFARYDTAFKGVTWERCKSRPWKVYVLVDPLDCTARYVGVTRNPKQRRMQHRSVSSSASPEMTKWKASLASYGALPLMAVIDSASSFELAMAAESRWIHYYACRGKLYNILDFGSIATSKALKEPTHGELGSALRALRRR